jgi:epoxyqueuosine reductase
MVSTLVDDQNRDRLSSRLKEEARRIGFDDVGIAPAVTPPGYPHFLDWLARGCQAGMTYLERGSETRADPDRLWPGARGIVVVSMVYGEPQASPESPKKGRIARYARGVDYHEVLWRKLEELLAWLQKECPGAEGRAVADSAPLLERDYAQLAGLGWIAKNTMLISRTLGSFTVLGALLVNVDLTPDRPFAGQHCGSCTRCLDVCPTQALTAPYQLDARRCISYWTIEHRGPIVPEFADQLHGWVFGCDICQDVCPWNRKALPTAHDEFRAREEWSDPDLIDWLMLDRSSWTAMLKGTALKRTKRTGLLRNAALILGTRQVHEATDALIARLSDLSEDSIIRAAAAWALGRLGSDRARSALVANQEDPDSEVSNAIRSALASS